MTEAKKKTVKPAGKSAPKKTADEKSAKEIGAPKKKAKAVTPPLVPGSEVPKNGEVETGGSQRAGRRKTQGQKEGRGICDSGCSRREKTGPFRFPNGGGGTLGSKKTGQS
jgi:hypothetical protein